MTHHNLYMTQHEVSFGVWDQGKCEGLLRIIPLGCEFGEKRDIRDAPRCSAYGIYVQATIEKKGFECTGYDFIDPQQLRTLREMLASGPNQSLCEAAISGADGGIEINFRWRKEGDISVIGQIPPEKNLWEHWLARDPLILRKHIRTSVKFEFLIDPEATPEACSEIDRLLAYIRSLEDSNSK